METEKANEYLESLKEMYRDPLKPITLIDFCLHLQNVLRLLEVNK